MVAILLYEARSVGLQGMQWFWLVVITTLVAGACIWIISWGDEEEEEGNNREQGTGNGEQGTGVRPSQSR